MENLVLEFFGCFYKGLTGGTQSVDVNFWCISSLFLFSQHFNPNFLFYLYFYFYFYFWGVLIFILSKEASFLSFFSFLRLSCRTISRILRANMFICASPFTYTDSKVTLFLFPTSFYYKSFFSLLISLAIDCNSSYIAYSFSI